MQHYIIPADPRSRGLKLGSLHARARRHGYWITHDRHAGTWSLIDADLKRPLVGLAEHQPDRHRASDLRCTGQWQTQRGAKMIRRTSHLTQGHPDVLTHQIRATHPGQAHFANTGPFGATCGDCLFLGYRQQIRNETGDIVKTVRRTGCKKFYELTNKHGPAVPAHAAACRYFSKEEASK